MLSGEQLIREQMLIQPGVLEPGGTNTKGGNRGLIRGQRGIPVAVPKWKCSGTKKGGAIGQLLYSMAATASGFLSYLSIAMPW